MKHSWLKCWLTGRPHFIIGGPDRPYLWRWYVIPRNRRFNVYLHKFWRDDDDRALHDHPWWFVSVMLKGQYREITDDGLIERRTLTVALRRALHRHRVELLRDCEGNPVPCWTLVLTGSAKRVWGFWCPKGFVPWMDFVKPDDTGAVGRGCE